MTNCRPKNTATIRKDAPKKSTTGSAPRQLGRNLGRYFLIFSMDTPPFFFGVKILYIFYADSEETLDLIEDALEEKKMLVRDDS